MNKYVVVYQDENERYFNADRVLMEDGYLKFYDEYSEGVAGVSLYNVSHWQRLPEDVDHLGQI